MEHPILFSTEMVQAILEGKKTQTRRVIEVQPEGMMGICKCHYSPSGHAYSNTDGSCTCQPVDFPYGQPGGDLWVRETWRLASINAEIADAQFWTVQFADFHVMPHPQPKRELFLKLAEKDKFQTSNTGIKFGRWRPSIHMYRWMSRINLGIVHIRAERLQDITDEDATKEGIQDVCHCGDYVESHGYHSGHSAVSMPGWATENFASLWDSINGKRGYPWALNPWVWVIEFQKVQ